MTDYAITIYPDPGTPPPPPGNNYYVAPNGKSSNNGSINSPWDFNTAFGQPRSPGDNYYMRGGLYSNTYNTIIYLTGSSSNPITVQSYPGEWAILDGGTGGINVGTLQVRGSYTTYRDFEITALTQNRVSTQSGSNPTDITLPDGVRIFQASGTGPGNKFVNLYVHDVRQGFSWWVEASNSTAYGCISMYNGWTAPDRGHGHACYTQNQAPSTKTIEQCVTYSGFGLGMQIYGSGSAYADNYTIKHCTGINAGDLEPTGGSHIFLLGLFGGEASNNTIDTNVFYRTGSVGSGASDGSGTDFQIGYLNSSTNVVNTTVTGNYIPCSAYFYPNVQGLTATGNDFFGVVTGISTGSYPNNTYHGKVNPTGVIVRGPYANAYEAGRSTVTILNWDGVANATVDMTGFLTPGHNYAIYNALNYTQGANQPTPIATGAYNGGTIAFPLSTLTVAPPRGIAAPPNPAPTLGVFIVRTTS